jgi:2-hydroxychromene-2-carboxylate isomerase
VSLKPALMPWIAAGLSSTVLQFMTRQAAEFNRRVWRKPHTLDVFIKLDDPYSWLLLQALPELQQRFSLTIELHAIHTLADEMFPEKEKWRQLALNDSLLLAKTYQLNAASAYPKGRVEAYLPEFVQATQSNNPLVSTSEVFERFWQEEPPSTSILSEDVESTLTTNEQKLAQLGHYLSATIFYGGEWYWGLDRLYHLEHRLNTLIPVSTRTATRYRLTELALAPKTLPQASDHTTQATDATSLTMYFSARSPYSYLGLENALRLCRHYDIKLTIKPVLPMVMRGLSVPQRKKMYIFHDTKREAVKLGIPYGKVADPLGSGVERCYALFNYAQNEGKEIVYLSVYARAVNSEGLRSETDRGLRTIVERSGLSWEHAKTLLADASEESASWRNWAESNRKELEQLGLWGVPCFRYGDISVWGQDRLFVLENKIRSEMGLHS